MCVYSRKRKKNPYVIGECKTCGEWRRQGDEAYDARVLHSCGIGKFVN